MIFFPFNKNIVKLFLTLFVLCLSYQSFAQEKCGTVIYHKIRQLKHSHLEGEDEFEQFIRKKTAEKRASSAFRTQQDEVYQIPVVVHIIHKGEPIGTGVNLSDERILSQIRTLNEDFRRQNADTILTPSQYLDVAADTHIEFVLAKTNPEGFPTTGIVRMQGAQSEWNIGQNEELKAQSYWPAEDYMNIWVTDLSADLLGYAQFPISDLPGLEFSENNRLTDGVVIDYIYFGENPHITPRSFGRTTTHEVGHFLGLRHVWGDGGCNVDDYCDDTPDQNRPNYTCTTERTSCGSRDMFENYMDYTDDACMNLFTLCQRTRMRIVMENSPRRSSLKESPGLQDPQLVENDAGLMEIINPPVSSCESTFSPEILVANQGTNNISSVQIAMFLNNSLEQTTTFNVSLSPSESTTLTFTALTFTEKGPHTIRFEVVQTNGEDDNNPVNNNIQRTFYIRTEGELPLVVNFTEIPEDWLVLNPDNRIGWQAVNVPGMNMPAAMMNFYQYDRGLGELDYLLSPSLDMRDLVYARLTFQMAYAQFPNVENDGLVVAISRDCGNTFPNAAILYRAHGSEMATAPPTESPFIPASRVEWRPMEFDLSPFIGDPNIQIAFISQNGHGNRLYITDVAVEIKRRQDVDLNLLAIHRPSVASCNSTPEPVIEVRNDGRTAISTFTVNATLNDTPLQAFQFAGTPIPPGGSTNITLPQISLPEGHHHINIFIDNVNGANGHVDDFPEDNERSLNFLIDNERDIIPHRENFEGIATFNQSQWSVVNPDNGITWTLEQIDAANFSTRAAMIRNFVYDARGQRDWLVSPVFDFSHVQEASMFFSIAHAFNRNYPDALEIRVSRDCGDSYPDRIFFASGENLSTATSTEEWFPEENADFRREFVNLSRYAGEENIRIAFIATTGFGNNLFIDDIEFFVSADQEPVAGPVNNFIIYPNPASDFFSATFNLQQREDIILSIYDGMGRKILQRELPNTLNQTYEFDLAGVASGVYLMRFQGQVFNSTKRIIIR